jgi:ribA/ribD-fused uncharacterized protein
MKIINNFRKEYYYLSNFYSADIIFDEIKYLNNEAAFQAQKTLNLNEREQFSLLSPNLAKSKGRKVKLRIDWENVKDDLMYQICKCKFEQNVKLKELLLSTKNSILEEGNDWNDTYWGICNGIGQNKLGKILMQIREEFNK